MIHHLFALPLVTTLSLVLAFASSTYAGTYKPRVPKTCPTTKVIVYDVTQEKEQFPAALPAIACIQGLVNRTSAEKIFLKGVPFRCFWKVEEDHPRNAGRVGPGNPFDDMLEELIPYPKEYPEVDRSKRAPVLSHLMKNYGHLVKGKVYSDQWSPGRMPAVNTCVFEDGILITPVVDQLLKSEGYDLRVLADYSGVDDCFDATEISVKKYLNHPKRNTQMVGYGTNTPGLDYCVATCTFSLYIDQRELKPDQHDTMQETILDIMSHFDPGALGVGYIEQSHANKVLGRNGYQPVCGELPNASMTSSILTVPEEFYPEKPGRVLPLDPNGIYITWFGVDVDAIDFALLTYKALRNDPAGGQAPLLIKMNPYLADWFPTLFKWFTEYHPEQMDFFYAPYGDGPPPKGTPTTDHCAHYVANTNGAFGSHEVMESGLPLFEMMGGYMGEPERFKVDWGLNKGTVWGSKLGGIRFGPKNPHPYDPDTDELVRYVKSSILLYGEAGKPYFMIGRIPSESGVDGFGILKAAQDRLTSDPEIERPLYFVRPFDLAATYKEYRESGAFKAKPAALDHLSATELLDLLVDADRTTRCCSALALCRKSVESSGLLPAFQSEKDRQVKRILALAISHGEPSGKAIQAAMVQSLGDEAVGTAAAKVLAKIGPAAFDDLQSALQSNNTMVELNAVRALQWMECDAKPAVDVILEALKHSTDWQLSVALIQALGRFGPEAKESVDMLIQLTADSEKPVYRAALDALGRVGDAQTVPIVIAALNTEDAFDGGAAAKALGHMGLEASEASPALLDLLRRGRKNQIDRYLLGEVVTAAARLKLTEAIPLITELIHLRAETRFSAIVALSRFGPDAKAAIPDIVQDGLEHEWVAIRIASLEVLAAMGRTAEQAIPAIKQLQAAETDPEVLAAIEATLKEIEP